MICDLIWFLDYLLTGEITLRFFLKAATVMIICAGIFAYYLTSLKWTRTANITAAKWRNLVFATTAAAAVISSFCAGLVVAGTPTQQRLVEADRVRVDNLRTMAQAVKIWHDRESRRNPSATIPPNIEVLARGGPLTMNLPTDPLTHAPYEYHPQAGTRYELCANFSASNIGAPDATMHSDFWRYGRGKTCFVLDASEQAPW
jgi:hypothetical protein